MFGYRDAVLIFCGFMGLDAENDEVCIGIDRDGVLGFGGWLFLPRGRGLVSWLCKVGIVVTYIRLLVYGVCKACFTYEVHLFLGFE